MTAASSREPVLRVVPGPSDINANGHIFGGWVLSQMDIAGSICAVERVQGLLAELRAIASVDLSMLSVAARQLRGLVAG